MVRSTRKLRISASIAALFVGCTAVAAQEASYTPPPPGSTWQMSQRNTGSFGRDAEVVTTRGEDVTWQGSNLAKYTLSNNGVSTLITPDGKWVAHLAQNGATLITYDPPIGYEYPLKVGKSWKTQHKIISAAGTSPYRAEYRDDRAVIEYDNNCTVESFDRVTVRAGTFDAFKIVCENVYVREVKWFDAANGVHVKLDMLRKPGNPNGKGTQQAELVALNLAK